MGLVSLKEEEKSQEFPLSEGYKEKAENYKLGRESTPQFKSVGTLILDLLATRTVRIKCLLLKPSSL
jgi:hypothetical protein